jgi:hypothetical protein
MLLIAGGVGLLGGVGAALLDIRNRKDSSTQSSVARFFSSIVLGGIAAVAVLYFFPPAQEVLHAGVDPDLTTEYDLTKLVALSLIVGSAGPAFLATLQTKTLALSAAEEKATAATATATQAISGVADQAATIAKASVAASAPEIQAAVQQAGGPALSTAQVDNVASQLADKAETAVADSLSAHVESAQRSVAGASATV